MVAGGPGGGGSNYATGNLYSISLRGIDTTPPYTTDSMYVAGAAVGGSSNTSGGNGLLVIQSTVYVDFITPKILKSSGSTIVNITGAGFDAGTTVTIGGQACSALSILSTSDLTCTAPPGTNGTSQTLAITTSQYGSLTVADAVSYRTADKYLATGRTSVLIPPAGCNNIFVKAWGGGGAGSISKGAAGGYATGIVAVTPGETLTVTVATGGRRAANSSASGGFGGGGDGGSAAGNVGSSGGGGRRNPQRVGSWCRRGKVRNSNQWE